MSSAEVIKTAQELFAQHCAQWTEEFGYRLICRKAIANEFFNSKITNIADPAAPKLLDDVISVSPLEPAYYTLRAKLGLYTFAPTNDIVTLLRLSYLSGRSVQSLMYERFKIAYAIWDVLDQTDKSVALNDFLKHRTVKRDELYQLILGGSPQSFEEIVQMVKGRDQEIYNRFIQDTEQKR